MNLRRVLGDHATFVRLHHKVKQDRLFLRSSALAFETLLAVVPLTAVAMASVRALGDKELQHTVLHYLAEQYLPASAGAGVVRVLELIEQLDLSTIGLVGLAALVPVMFSMVNAVELALSDIFRSPRRAHWWRFAFLAALLTGAPLGTVLTVRYVPITSFAYSHFFTPLLLISLVLYLVFRSLPSVSLKDRATMLGALTAGALLSLAKVGFGLYATHLATSIHMLWGAIAFVPLLLLWVLLTWSIVLMGAEFAAVLDAQLKDLEQVKPPRRPARRSPRNQRLRRRLLHRQRRACERSPSPQDPAMPRLTS